MASPPFLLLFFMVSLLFASPHFSLASISLPPSPSPHLSLAAISLPPSSSSTYSVATFSESLPPTPASDSPSLSPFASPPLSPFASPPIPSDSQDNSSPVPAPVPSVGDMKSGSTDSEEEKEEEREKSGLDGGKKAGVVVGVFAATAFVVLGFLVCKKRQENIKRSRYGDYTSRVEMI